MRPARRDDENPEILLDKTAIKWSRLRADNLIYPKELEQLIGLTQGQVALGAVGGCFGFVVPGHSQELPQNPFPLIAERPFDGVFITDGHHEAGRQFPVIVLLGLHGATPALMDRHPEHRHAGRVISSAEILDIYFHQIQRQIFGQQIDDSHTGFKTIMGRRRGTGHGVEFRHQEIFEIVLG